ncbi:hypothetical protein BDW71DRAFT_191387 [Aspergillus fruticulosus]
MFHGSGIKTCSNRQTSRFLQNTWRFLLTNREAINEAPFRPYSSAIMFREMLSVARSASEQHSSKSVYQPPVMQPSWGCVLLSSGNLRELSHTGLTHWLSRRTARCWQLGHGMGLLYGTLPH